MTGRATETQWYIARDGQQHGPLSDSEMRAFVEQRHLRTTDLVWRPGFADWRPAPLIFPMQTQPGETPVEGIPGAAAAEGHNAAPGARDSYDMGAPAWMEHQGANPDGARGREEGKPFDGGELRPLQKGREAGREVGVEPRRSIVRRVAALAATAAVLAGGWFAWTNREEIARIAGSPFTAAFLEGKSSPDAQSARLASLDTRLQRSPAWVAVKKAFPDWYAERLREILQQQEGEPPDERLTRHLAEAFAALRRAYADAALSASTPKLHAMALAFLDTLKALSAESTEACYAFISQGVTSPTLVLRLQGTEETPIQRHVIAVAEAMAEGRAAPVAHEHPVKADYDALVNALVKAGWTKTDLQLFADPRALAGSTPEKVCKMVTDWFGAHMAIEDASARERLLTESLRPVVGN